MKIRCCQAMDSVLTADNTLPETDGGNERDKGIAIFYLQGVVVESGEIFSSKGDHKKIFLI